MRSRQWEGGSEKEAVEKEVVRRRRGEEGNEKQAGGRRQ